MSEDLAGSMKDINTALDILRMVGDMKRKAYIPEWMVQQYCPTAQRVYKIEPNMYSFEILYDSVEKFFRENTNIHKVYIDIHNNVADADQYLPQIIDHSSYVIKCSFK